MSIRRRPSVATVVAVVVTLVLGSQTGFAAGSSQAPQAVASVEVTATDGSSVTIAWPPSRNSDSVVAYGVYVNGSQVGTQTADQVKRWRDRQAYSYTIEGLACGTGYTVGVDVVDRDHDRSPITQTTVSTSACPDAAAPSAPTGVRQVAATETSVVLAWTASSDNVGVVEYGLYASGVRVSTVSDASATLTSLKCGTSYLIAIDAADAAGNRSAQASSFFRTSGCPSSNQPPTTPTLVRVASASQTSVALSWTASTDDVAVTGYGLYLSGSRTSETTGTTGQFTGLKCGTTYTLGVDAKDGGGLRSAVASLSTATSPCSPPPPPSSTGTVTQTIANGSTIPNLNNWRGVYDANGDGVEDDPGSIQFLVDGTQVLSEINAPFGDTFANGTITTSNGQHTFQVRALNDAGTLLATNTITATVTTTTPPPPPPPTNTGKVTQTIANGSTIPNLNNWRGVYDANGDGVEDDPGSIQFLVDGTQVLSEINAPFGDTFANGTITTSNGQHTFQVRALNDSGTLLATNTITATVTTTTPPPSPAGDTIAPSQPGNLKVASASPTGVAIAWNAATDNVGVTGYDLYRNTSRVGTTPQTTASFSGLTCGTGYPVGVDAFDAAGNSSPPANMTVTTSACPDSQPPTAPVNVTVSTRTTTSIALTWAAATDNVGVAGYGVYNGADLVQTTAGTTGIVSSLTCGTSYTLAVDAFDATGNSSTKTAIMVSTLPCGDTTPPTQPTNLRTISATTSSLALAWNASTDNVAVARYDIYRATTKVGTATTTSYTMSGLTCGTTYTVGVRAVDTTGNTSAQANATATTSACVSPTQIGFPDSSNTGVPAGVALTPYTGPDTITTPNTVIDGKNINMCLYVLAPGLVIRNSKITCLPPENGGNGYFGIRSDPGAFSGTGTLIEDSEVSCGQTENTGLASANITARRVSIHGCANGLSISRNVTLEDSYVHDLTCCTDNHTDGIQFDGGLWGVGTSGLTIRHNTITGQDNDGSPGNSSIISDGNAQNVLLENNLFYGGGFTLYCSNGNTAGYVVRNNHFSTRIYPKVGTFGPVIGCSAENGGGNVYNETGLPVDMSPE